jgi:uncharacterized iron-regulated membrane protein
MDPIEKQERKREAWRRLRAQRQRAGQLRGRVVAISLICFVLLWGIVFAQMATGNDPVLSNKQATASASTADKRHRAQAKVLPAEEESTEADELEAARAAEFEAAEVEAAEAELLQAEAEVEPEPVITSQS